MKNLLKKLDIYGGKIQFYYKYKQEVQTTFGGFMTMVLLSFFVFLVVEFGNNFFYGLNPFVIVQEQNKAYDKKILTHENFMFAWRMEDINAELLDPNRTSVDFIIKHASYFRNSTTKEWNSTYYPDSFKELPFERCDISMFKSPSTQKIYNAKNFKNFYCVNLDEFPLGGYWDADEFVYAFYVEFIKCKENKTSSSGQKCKPQDDTISLISNYAYASFYFPTATVDPSDYDNPISLDVKNVFYLLDPTLKLTTYNRFQEIIMISDNGWILENKHESSAIAFSYTSSDYVTTEMADKNDSYSGVINSSVFYYDKYKKIYNRTYTKIQNLAAEVGGVLKLLTFVLTIVVQTYNKYYLEYDLIKVIGSNLNDKELSDISKKFALANKIDDEISQTKAQPHKTMSNNYLMELTNTASKIPTPTVNQMSKDNDLKGGTNEIRQINAKIAQIETVLAVPARISYFFKSKEKTKGKQKQLVEIAQSVSRYFFLDNICLTGSNQRKCNTVYLKNMMMDILDVRTMFKTSILQKKVNEILFTDEQLSMLE